MNYRIMINIRFLSLFEVKYVFKILIINLCIFEVEFIMHFFLFASFEFVGFTFWDVDGEACKVDNGDSNVYPHQSNSQILLSTSHPLINYIYPQKYGPNCPQQCKHHTYLEVYREILLKISEVLLGDEDVAESNDIYQLQNSY